MLTFHFEETDDKSNTKQGHQLSIRKVENVLAFWDFFPIRFLTRKREDVKW